ncbi:S66 peptidase family protein [Brevundimonas sp.]|uniref:S66 peptidase family protein n=1 Tax=Brevundimonas sp. TaxID=1871086 RepID=UPI003F704F57
MSLSAPEPVAEPDRFKRGLRALEARGYRVVVSPSAEKRHGYLSAPERELAADLMAAFLDPGVDAIICAGGGTNANRLLKHLDYDAIRRNPKILVGLSNPTTVLNAIHARTGLVVFHGPVVVWNLGEPGGLDPFSTDNMWPMLEQKWRERPIPPEPTWRWLRGGSASGPLLGGNLISLQCLLGTSHEPNWDGAILFWEDIAKPVNRLDLMLTHFRDVGVFDRIAGMVVGRLVACDEPKGGLSLEHMLEEVLEGTEFPVLNAVSLGHTPEKVTLPVGAMAELNSGTERFSIVEAVTI